MKKVLLLLWFLLSVSATFAVEYRSVGSNADFCVYTFDGKYYLILSFKDDNDNRLSDYTIVKFKLKDGTVLTLEGAEGSRVSSITSYGWGHVVYSSSSEDKHYAIVYITPEQIEMLKQGVEKVAINTIPEVYKRSKWVGKDLFGYNLYYDFKNLKNEFDE